MRISFVISNKSKIHVNSAFGCAANLARTDSPQWSSGESKAASGGSRWGKAASAASRNPSSGSGAADTAQGSEQVIGKYRRLQEPGFPQERELRRLLAQAREGTLELLCWCHPLSCHAEVVRGAVIWLARAGCEQVEAKTGKFVGHKMMP